MTSVLDLLVSFLVVCCVQDIALPTSGLVRGFVCATSFSVCYIREDSRGVLTFATSSLCPTIFIIDVNVFLIVDCLLRVLVPSILVIICGLMTDSSRVFRLVRADLVVIIVSTLKPSTSTKCALTVRDLFELWQVVVVVEAMQ